MQKLALIIPLLMLTSAGCNSRTPRTNNAPQFSSGATVTQDMETPYTRTLLIGGRELKAQVVATPADMAQGLSGRTSLGADEGMLFDFGTVTAPSFWMKDMNFDLDLVWIRGGKIIGITPRVPAPPANLKLDIGSLKLYNPPSPIDQVLEVNAGWSKKNNISVRDVVKLKQ